MTVIGTKHSLVNFLLSFVAAAVYFSLYGCSCADGTAFLHWQTFMCSVARDIIFLSVFVI